MSLCCLGSRCSTRSPICRVWEEACRRESTYAFIFALAALSLFWRSWSDAAGASVVRIGIFVRILRWNNGSAGDVLVVLCGVARYPKMNSCCLNGIYMLPARRSTLSRVCINRSAEQFACGQNGVILQRWNPRYSANLLIWSLLKGGPLSVFTT